MRDENGRDVMMIKDVCDLRLLGGAVVWALERAKVASQ